jgi:hypothetical protein
VGSLLRVAFACTLAASCGGDGDHTGIPASPPFDPIGSEPTSGDAGTGAVLDLLCTQFCANLAAACPNDFQNNYCMPQCLNSLNTDVGCEAKEFLYTACLATAHIDCLSGLYHAATCDPALQSLSDCLNSLPPTPH